MEPQETPSSPISKVAYAAAALAALTLPAGFWWMSQETRPAIVKNTETLTDNTAAVREEKLDAIRKLAGTPLDSLTLHDRMYDLRPLILDYIKYLRSAPDLTIKELDYAARVSVTSLNYPLICKAPDTAWEAEFYANDAVLALDDLLLEKLGEIKINNLQEQELKEQKMQMLCGELLYFTNSTFDVVWNEAARIYSKHFLSTSVNFERLKQGVEYGGMGDHIFLRVICNDSKLLAEQYQKLLIETERMPHKERSVRLLKITQMQDSFDRAVAAIDKDPLLKDRANEMRTWYDTSIRRVLFDTMLKAYLPLYEADLADGTTKVDEEAKTPYYSRWMNYFSETLKCNPEWSVDYLRMLSHKIESPGTTIHGRFFAYASAAYVSSSTKGDLALVEFVKERLVQEDDRDALRRGLAPLVQFAVLRDYLGSAQGMKGQDAAAEFAKNRQEYIDESSSTPLRTLIAEILANARENDRWRYFLGKDLIENEVDANVVNRMQAASHVVATEFLLRTAALLPPDEALELETSEDGTSLPTSFEFPLKNHGLFEIKVEHTASTGICDALRHLEDYSRKTSDRFARIEFYGESPEQVAHRVMDLLRLHSQRFSDRQSNEHHWGESLRELGASFRPMHFEGAIGPFAAEYRNVRDYLYGVKYGRLVADSIDEKLDGQAREIAEASERIFACELALELWGEGRGTRPLDIHEHLSDTQMKREVIRILRTLNVLDASIDLELQFDALSPESFLEKVRGLRLAAQRREAALRQSLSH